MSDYNPPSEKLPIFNSLNFSNLSVSTTEKDPTKLDFPTAQGAETFPSGLTTTTLTTNITRIVNTITYYNNTTSIKYENTGNTIFCLPPIFQTLPTTNPNNTSTLYPLNISLNLGGTYIVFASVSIRNSVAGTTGSEGFAYSFTGSQTAVQEFDWYAFPPFGNSGLNVVGTGENTGYDTAVFSGVLTLPPSNFLYNTTGTSNIYLGVYNWNATGNWIFNNSGNSIYFLRIA
jgi:hypothetical protein